MREIKFRGLDLNRNWVYGDLCTHYEGEPDSIYIIDEDCTYHEVIKETVGQFTGLLDKNGKEIYEMDVIHWKNIHGDVIGKVEYEIQAAAFWLKWKIHNENRYKEFHATSGGDSFAIDYFEIIGNVHQNPELLK